MNVFHWNWVNVFNWNWVSVFNWVFVKPKERLPRPSCPYDQGDTKEAQGRRIERFVDLKLTTEVGCRDLLGKTFEVNTGRFILSEERLVRGGKDVRELDRNSLNHLEKAD